MLPASFEADKLISYSGWVGRRGVGLGGGHSTMPGRSRGRGERINLSPYTENTNKRDEMWVVEGLKGGMQRE